VSVFSDRCIEKQDSIEGMSVIWYAIAVYMVGIAIVLYVRPTFMFQDNGMWKEFGLSKKQHTVFPFWMFAVTWAILSYAFASLASMMFASIAIRASNNTMVDIQPISTAPAPANAVPAAANARAAAPAAAANATTPGYYILDPFNQGPQPKYIYYGPNPPGST
jgi:hypothetical protein